jgi:hypothetical protein
MPLIIFVSSSFNTYVNLPKKKVFWYENNNKSNFIGHYIISRYENPLYDQFAAQLNLQLKPQETKIKISPNLISGVI